MDPHFAASHYPDYDAVDSIVKQAIDEYIEHRKSQLTIEFNRGASDEDMIPYYVVQCIMHNIYSAKNDWYDINYLVLRCQYGGVNTTEFILQSVTIDITKLVWYITSKYPDLRGYAMHYQAATYV
uniref:Uncharacterized protein n=1 Tax=viral metagenome TaxID=1070528 RepID=A0A6C0EB83_9ZZZZ